MRSIHGIPIQHADPVELEMRSATMPAHPDVPARLKQFNDAGFGLSRFRTRRRRADHTAKARWDRWSLRKIAERCLVRMPEPQAYHMAAEELYASTAEICMVSTHLWDTLGAQNLGCPAALISRRAMRRRPSWRCFAGGGADWVRSSERGCAADQTLALTAFGPT